MRLFILFILFLLSACQGHHSKPLQDETWQLQAMPDKQLELGDQIELRFQANQVIGYAGCNRYFAQFQQQDQTITLSQIGSTKRYCPNMALEQAFLSQLAKVDRFQRTQNTLNLYENNQLKLVFTLKQGQTW